jgi:hypothetical protein
MQQAAVMLIAAVTVSGGLSLDYGESICIQLSIVQVALALPEQLWTIWYSIPSLKHQLYNHSSLNAMYIGRMDVPKNVPIQSQQQHLDIHPHFRGKPLATQQVRDGSDLGRHDLRFRWN